MKRILLSALLCTPLLCTTSSYSDYLSIKRKFDLIEEEKMKPGTRVSITPQELNAYAENEVPMVVPQGVRHPHIELGNGSATGSALIDFLKLQQAQGGQAPNWLVRKLLEGEKPVRVTALIRSAAGRASVDVERVEIAGVPIEGRALDFLLQNYLLPRFPDAKIGQPFQLGHHIERLEVKPSNVGVIIGR